MANIKNQNTSWALRFQPTHPQWQQQSAWMRDILLNDYIFWRPHVVEGLILQAKQIKPDLQVVASIDAWIPSKEIQVSGQVKRVPDCPDGYALPKQGGGVWHFAEGHPWILPNHNHPKPTKVIDYILDRFLFEPLGPLAKEVDWGFHDWCQTSVYIDGFPEAEIPKALEFRRMLLSRMRERLERPVGYNAGSITKDWIDVVDGVLVEGHELGGNYQQIEYGLSAWHEAGKDIFWVSRPYHETGGYEDGDTPVEGNTGHRELMRGDWARAQEYGAHFSWSYGHAYETFWLTPEQESDGLTYERLLPAPSSKPHRVVARAKIEGNVAEIDKVSGFDWMRSSPGQSPAKTTVEETLVESFTSKKPHIDLAGTGKEWTTGPIYNATGDSFSYHEEMGVTSAIHRFFKPAHPFQIMAWNKWSCRWSAFHGNHEVKDDTILAFSQSTLSLRFEMGLATECKIPTDFISMKQAVFGLFFNGEADFKSIEIRYGKEGQSVADAPVSLMGNFRLPRMQGIGYVAVFDDSIIVNKPEKVNIYVGLNNKLIGKKEVTLLP